MKTPQLLTRKIAASLVCLALLMFTGSALAADNTGSGGTITYTDPSGLNPVTAPPYIGGFVVHTFTANDTLVLPSAASADVLVVAGGGGGGAHYGDGGGAGGLIYSNLSLNAGSYSATIGAGGAGGVSPAASPGAGGTNGANSAFSTLTALGGGGGGVGYTGGGAGIAGQAGGSGGGGGGGNTPWDGGAATQPSSASGGFGNAGATGTGTIYGGGGGAGAAATSYSGGNGLQYNISGVNTYYAGGGGGINGGGTGGLGGGGNPGASGQNGVNGAANTGGGGGGAFSTTGGNGGSGIVIVRYPYVGSPALSVAVTSPNGQTLLHGFPISATAFVAAGTGPYSVTYHYKLTTAGSYTTTTAVGPFGGTNTFTQVLGILPVGSYQVYATVADSAAGAATSVTNTFTVINVNNFSFEQDATPGGANTIAPTGWTAFYGAQPSNYIGSQAAANAQYPGSPPLTSPGDANQFLYINNAGGAGADGIYQDVGTLQANTIYTLTVAVGSRADWTPGPNGQGTISLLNGTNQTGTVLGSTTSSIAPQAGAFTDYTVTIGTGGSVSGDLIIDLADLGPSGFTQVNFDNVRLSYVVSPVPLPTLLTNTTPASATVALGSNVVFTAAFSNSPPVVLQWQKIVSNTTNNINTGVVTVTNNGVVSTTLTLNNVQLTDAASYQVEAANATNLVTIVYSSLAPLTVIPTITWYAAGTYNYSFTNNSVLALAGSVANEVYGVNFGVGLLTTANGYVFDDYQTAGNMSVAGSLNAFPGYLGTNSTGDGNLDFMLANGDYGTSANTATLNNLTVGQAYTVLVLLADTRPVADGSTIHVTDGLTDSPNQRYAFANGSPAIGGYIMGTFTAAATTQPFTVLNNSGSQYQVVLLEKGIATPPPNPPELTTDISPPLLYRVTTGGAVTFSVVAGGSLPLHYQWFNQGGPIGSANSTNYLFNAVAGTNSYYVIITNNFGSVTSSIAVVISATNVVTVNNFSFEQDSTPGGANTISPTGWTAFYAGEPNNFIGSQAAANGQYTASPPLTSPGDENQFMYVNNDGSGGVTNGVYQDVGALLANTTYTLTVAIGSRADWTPGPNGQGTISLLNGTDQTGTLLTSTTSNVGVQTGTFTDWTATFTTSGSVSGDLIVDLSVVGTPSVFTQGDFDNVRLTQTSVAVAPPTLPTTFARPIVSGGNLILTGSGGTPASAQYIWLTTTNLSAPIIWTTNFTGTLSAGAFSNSFAIGTNRASFFRFVMP